MIRKGKIGRSHHQQPTPPSPSHPYSHTPRPLLSHSPTGSGTTLYPSRDALLVSHPAARPGKTTPASRWRRRMCLCVAMLERDRGSGEKLKKRHTTSVPPRRLHHSHCMIRMRAWYHKFEVVIAVRLHRRDVHAVERVLAVLRVEGWEVPV